MSEKRFIVIENTNGAYIKDNKTGEQWWDLGYDEGFAQVDADMLNTAKHIDAVLKWKHESHTIETFDKLISEATAPLEQRIINLEAIIDNIQNNISDYDTISPRGMKQYLKQIYTMTAHKTD